MDLKLDDVAELLNVSPSTVMKWLDEGLIPSYSINQQPRFSRQEIESWMLTRKAQPLESPASHEASEPEYSTKGWQQFCLFRAIHKGMVLINSSGRTKEAIIAETMQQAAGSLNLDAQVLTDLLLDREKMMSTAINQGIAVPHTRDFLLKSHHDLLIVVFLEKPIDWGAMDRKETHTLFFLFACDDRHHLNLLAKLAHLSSDESALAKLQERPQKEELLQFVKHWEAKVPASSNF